MVNVQLDRPAERVGHEGKHLSLLLKEGSTRMKAIGFQMGRLAEDLPAGLRLDLVFEPKINTFRGTRRPELHLCDLQVSPAAEKPQTSDASQPTSAHHPQPQC
jgi:hypothetical protein